MARFVLLTLALLASLATSGCCSLQAISCRYGESGSSMGAGDCCLPGESIESGCQHHTAASALPCDAAPHVEGPCLDRLLARGALLHHALRGRLYWPETPAGQIVPQPKFHPVPTRPVFEPRPEYADPLLLETPSHAFLPGSDEAAVAVPTPAKQPAADQPLVER